MEVFGKKTLRKTTTTQFEVLVKEMEKNTDLGRGVPVFGSDRGRVEERWEEIKVKVNSHGPPSRTAVEWKKIWADLKSRTKRKIAENAKSLTSTGGGPFRHSPLSEMEQAIDRIAFISKSAAPNGRVVGIPSTAPSTSSRRSSTEMPQLIVVDSPDRRQVADVLLLERTPTAQGLQSLSVNASTIRRSTKIFTVDARNHGDSPHTIDHDSVHMAQDVIELMKSTGIEKSCVMGHSMGGRTMMHLALKHPELVDRAIIVDISPIAVPRDFSHMEEIFTAMKSINIPADHSLGQGRKIAENQIKDAVRSQATVEFILMNLQKRKNGEFYWVPNIEVLHKNLRLFDKFMDNVKHSPPFNGPVMFICGNQSNFVDPGSWPAIQQMFPNAELHWLDAGHLVHFDQPEQFINLVANFLNR